jgi:hypothetical protein
LEIWVDGTFETLVSLTPGETSTSIDVEENEFVVLQNEDPDFGSVFFNQRLE